MSGTPTPRSSQLAPDLRHGRRGGVVVDRDPHQLGAGVGQRGDLERGARPRPRCRCWSSTGRRPGGASRPARRRRRRWASGAGRAGAPRPRSAGIAAGVAAASAGAAPSAEPLDVEEGDPDEQRHQQRRSRSGRPAARQRADAVAASARWTSAIATRPPSSGGNGSALTTARLADSTPMSQRRKTGGSSVADQAHGADHADRARTCGLARLVIRSPEPAQDERRRVDRALEADHHRVERAVAGCPRSGERGGRRCRARPARRLVRRMRRVTGTSLDARRPRWRTVRMTCLAGVRAQVVAAAARSADRVASKTGKRWPSMAMIRSPDSS